MPVLATNCESEVAMIGRRWMLGLLAGALVWLVSPTAAHAASLPAETEAALQSSDLIYVATERRDGSRSSVKPIWFYYTGDDKLFFTTSPDSWKAKRIAQGSPLYIWVGKKDGPFLIGQAESVTDPDMVDRMGKAYADKYWIAWLGFFKPSSARVTSGKTNAYLVTLRPAKPGE
jgi:general stress protein 26